MATTRSFAAFVWKKYSDDIEYAVSQYLDKNFKSLDLHSRYVQAPDEVSLVQLNFHRLIPFDAPGTTVKFDVLVTAEIKFYDTAHSEAVQGDAKRHFCVSCEAELNSGISDFQIKSIDRYNHHDNTPHGTLTDKLVPIIYKDQLDKIAEAILAEHYPEALAAPIQIDVRKFAEKMGLEIMEVRLSRGGTIFGEMIFSDCTIDYFNDSELRFDKLDVKRGTILVDPEAYFLRNLGSWNNTVIHECVHWRLHRKAFEFDRLYDDNLHMVRCHVAEGTADEYKLTVAEWKEWHANALAPRILMPKHQFQTKANALIAEHKRSRRTDRVSDVIEAVIYELSEFFGVSLQSAKIRMIDIGYSEAIGVLDYTDNRCMEACIGECGEAAKNRTFAVPAVDALVQYAQNDDFRRTIDTGNFVHIASHYCINDPKYVKQNEYGLLEMTEYAINHIDECCLVFDRSTYPNAEYGVLRYTDGSLFQNAILKNIAKFQYGSLEHNREVDARAAMMRVELLEVKETAKVVDNLPASFCNSLKMLMKWRGITVEQLAEKSLVSPKTIQRMRNKPEHNWGIETLISVCIGLQLPPYISTSLIKKAGLHFRAGEKGITYAHLLATHYRSPIFEFNEYLEAAGYPPLCSTE
jgi:hypothetical protein